MVETFEFNGKVYSRYPNSGRRSDRVYFKRSITGGTVWLHREIWQSAHGEIPKGFHIHHKDGNPSNNSLDNLECISAEKHISGHSIEFHANADNKRRVRQHLEAIRPLTKAWHRSGEGLAKHREIGAQAYKHFKPQPKPCKQCGKSFLPKALGSRDLFCSGKCKAAWRRASGVDDVERICPVCGTVFKRNKYAGVITCSRACANRYRSRNGKPGI